METRRSLGDDCLKDDDCLSGVCAQLRCSTEPPTFDAQVARAKADDAATDGPTETAAGETATDVDVETASETAAQSWPDAPVVSDDSGD